ncbi:glycosyltransferase family 4 protein [Pseudoalteromonas xiamenensis]|uniref:glycosyltransferase family 4 protein n=1 Tax=Pseudoalteromonas xiamenensis TaxID=882626 RepID=UPI0027E3C5DB|nr:glycosyltransferase family 4 protein [Pseudoalteromonas xiamenensis]WMN61197.1 glycosyltransferase family 4 protein [Pseudoalteromonas xiamenensis]
MANASLKPCVVLTSNQYKPNIGGIENSLYHLAQEYKNLNYEVIIVASDLNPENKLLPEVEIEDGVTIYRYRAEQSIRFGRGIKHIYNALKLYKQILKTYSPEVTVCRFHFNVVYLKVLGYKNVVYLVPGVVENETKASQRLPTKTLAKIKDKISFLLHKTVQRVAFYSADKLYVFSENMLQQIKKINSSKSIATCKPGVSLSRFNLESRTNKLQLRKELGLPHEGKVFLCIGRFVKAKGFDTAISALMRLGDNSVSLWLLGEGAEESELKALCERLNIADNVKFLGRQSCPEIYYKAADFFIMSSTYEPLGQTILEALSCGLPIIGARSSEYIITATSEILDSTNNILIGEHSVEAFAEGMRNLTTLSESDYIQLQQQNRALAEQNFSWHKLALELANDN